MRSFLLILILFPHVMFAATQFDVVQTYYQILHTPKSHDGRIEQVSRFFLGKPYKLAPLGEGKYGQFDTKPLYDFRAFDCLSFVEITLAMAYSKEPSEFITKLNHIRYENGVVDYLKRNHFMSLDWNPNNQDFVHDITNSIKDKNGRPISKLATTLIDKRAWLQAKRPKDLILPKASASTKKERLMELKARASEIVPKPVTITYIPLASLFDEKGDPRGDIFAQIPTAAIVEIVRPNWQLHDKIGTNLHISHLGFAFRTLEGKLVFRHAALDKQVRDEDLAKYLKKFINSPTVKGIKVLLPKKAENMV